MVHVHIYKVLRKAEIDVPTTDEKGALKIALELAKRGELVFEQRDCEFVAEVFDKEGKGYFG